MYCSSKVQTLLPEIKKQIASDQSMTFNVRNINKSSEYSLLLNENYTQILVYTYTLQI